MTVDWIRGTIFIALAALTIALAYLIQRHERVQSLKTVWIWPAVYTLLALRTISTHRALDEQTVRWMIVAGIAGLILGVARGLAFGVRTGEKPGTVILRPTLVSGIIFLIALMYNEYQHVFRWGDPSLERIAKSLIVLTAASSIAVNATRLVKWNIAGRR
jgi:lipoprotein signal peptidase